jgi:hypothetical protein
MSAKFSSCIHSYGALTRNTPRATHARRKVGIEQYEKLSHFPQPYSSSRFRTSLPPYPIHRSSTVELRSHATPCLGRNLIALPLPQERHERGGNEESSGEKHENHVSLALSAMAEDDIFGLLIVVFAEYPTTQPFLAEIEATPIEEVIESKLLGI